MSEIVDSDEFRMRGGKKKFKHHFFYYRYDNGGARILYCFYSSRFNLISRRNVAAATDVYFYDVSAAMHKLIKHA